MSRDTIITPDEASEVNVKRYQVYTDSRTGDPYKLIYYHEEDNFVLLRYDGDAEFDAINSGHYMNQLQQFKTEVAGDRWKLVEDPHN